MSTPAIVVGLFGGAAVIWKAMDSAGKPKLPHTVTNAEWSPTTWRRSAAWERVAGEPIMLNPLRRLND